MPIFSFEGEETRSTCHHLCKCTLPGGSRDAEHMYSCSSHWASLLHGQHKCNRLTALPWKCQQTDDCGNWSSMEVVLRGAWRSMDWGGGVIGEEGGQPSANPFWLWALTYTSLSKPEFTQDIFTGIATTSYFLTHMKLWAKKQFSWLSLFRLAFLKS